MKAILVGSLSAGFRLQAMINDDAAASPIQLTAKGEVAEVLAIHDPSGRDPELAAYPQGTWLTAFGTPRNGLTLYGPFPDYDFASDFGEKQRGDDEEFQLYELKARPDVSDVVPVASWDSPVYGHTPVMGLKEFGMKIVDLRHSHGQIGVDMFGPNGDVMNTVFEVNRIRGEVVDRLCLHLHFDDNRLAASFFKNGDKITMRFESGVSMREITLPENTDAYEIS